MVFLGEILGTATALIIGLASLVVSVFNTIWIQRTNQRAAAEARQRDVIDRVTEPLLYAASDLQSRLYNLLRGGLLDAYRDAADRHKRNITEYTCFVVAQYFGWVEALRRTALVREVSDGMGLTGERTGDSSPDGKPTIAIITREISNTFRSDKEFGREFMIFNGEQHAIGASMFYWEELGASRFPAVLRFDQFVQKFRSDDSSFREWLEPITEGLHTLEYAQDVEKFAAELRLARVQSLLVALMDLLDPTHAVFKQREPLIGDDDLKARLREAVESAD